MCMCVCVFVCECSLGPQTLMSCCRALGPGRPVNHRCWAASGPPVTPERPGRLPCTPRALRGTARSTQGDCEPWSWDAQCPVPCSPELTGVAQHIKPSSDCLGGGTGWCQLLRVHDCGSGQLAAQDLPLGECWGVVGSPSPTDLKDAPGRSCRAPPGPLPAALLGPSAKLRTLGPACRVPGTAVPLERALMLCGGSICPLPDPGAR